MRIIDCLGDVDWDCGGRIENMGSLERWDFLGVFDGLDSKISI